MELIKFEQCSLHYGEQVLMDGIDLSIQKGQKICLVGRNGTGKSTLLKLMMGTVKPDGGSIWRRQGLRIAYLEQDLPSADELTVYDVVASAFADLGECLTAYRHLSLTAHDSASLDELARLQQIIENQDGWVLQQTIEATLSRFTLDPDVTMGELSGGWRRRVLLAKALVIDPELLLLDEPTNHLDIQSIEWMEKQLAAFNGALVVISHDRHLLQQLGNRIAELDRGHLWFYNGTYQDFIDGKEKRLEEEARHHALFDKRLAEEEVWIRQGIKARRTRNEGRVRQLEKMRDERQQRREVQGKSSFVIDKGESSGKVVFEIENLRFRWKEDQPWIIDDFSTRILRGDRIGIIGRNGTGKSTLLQLMLEKLTATEGKMKQGTKLSVAYFDQQRNQLELEKSAIDNIAGGREFININGRDMHIISYLKDFMFTGERARTAVKTLSGGERNRILLAKLFSEPSNLLVLDEPTNDLDVETLELLEERLLDYDGTILMVSHDRAFLDNVVTNVIVFEDQGYVANYVGGYSYWQENFANATDRENPKRARKALSAGSSNVEAEPFVAKKKPSYQVQRELDQLPEKIAKQEGRVNQVNQKIADPAFYQSDSAHVDIVLADLAQQQADLDVLYNRWEELEA
ncbi:MAG: ATP-binding cassette subfamily F protein uup [Candidatus Endobugula sp.]|jgi:ATP-binding cassette subfamily F protein uup